MIKPISIVIDSTTFELLKWYIRLDRKDMDINEHERLSNLILIHKFSNKGYGYKWTWETIQLYTCTQI